MESCSLYLEKVISSKDEMAIIKVEELSRNKVHGPNGRKFSASSS